MQGLDWMDAQLATLASPTGRLVIWSAIAGVLSMGLYGMFSPQQRIADARAGLAHVQRRLDRFDGELGDALPLLRRLLGLALRQLALVLGPALLALAPLAVLAGWLGNHYGYAFPSPGQEVQVRTAPEQLQARLVQPQAAAPHIALEDAGGRRLQAIELTSPVPLLRKPGGLALEAAGSGRLPADAPVDRIELDLPQREYIAFGPSWMRGWAFVFFCVLTVVALAIKRAFHLH